MEIREIHEMEVIPEGVSVNPAGGGRYDCFYFQLGPNRIRVEMPHNVRDPILFRVSGNVEVSDL